MSRRAGYRVITTASRYNFDVLVSVGAEAVFDYHDPQVVEQINEYIQRNLRHVWDTVAVASTAQICADVISPGGSYGALQTVKFPVTM